MSADDTYNWANRAGNSWPCSELSGKRLFVELQRGDLVDIKINGRDGDCSSHELNAILEDYLLNDRK
jgi:hypothetical protein